MKMPQKLSFLACLWLFLMTFVIPVAADVLPVVKTKTETFQNVELISKTDTHVFLKHSRGVANVRQTDLDDDTMVGLGLKTAAATKPGEADHDAATVDFGESSELGGSLADGALSGKVRESMAPVLALIAGIWLLVLFGSVLLYLFYMILVWMICKKAGSETGWWIWVPFPTIQRYALLKAAGMSWLWILASVILNVVAGMIGTEQSQSAGLAVLIAGVALFVIEHVIWSVKISQARGKGVLTMICLIFPLTFPLAFMYLAFADQGSSAGEPAAVRPLRLEPLPTS